MQTIPPPEPNTRKPRIAVPAGTCDTHFHVFGPPGRYPLKPGALYDAQDLGLAELQRMHGVLGVECGVLITPTIYGTDNRSLVDLLREGGERYRGVVVIDDATTDAELAEMNEVGVRGARFNFAKFLKAVPEPDQFRRTIARIAPLGWHILIHCLGEELIEHETLFREVRVPVVVDHLGHLHPDDEPDKRALDILLDLLRLDNWWIKLSNGDRLSETGPPDYVDMVPLGRTLAEAAPDRALWCTDWPHVLYRKPKMANDGDLMDLLAAYVPDEAARNRILVDNPAALYGFGAGR